MTLIDIKDNFKENAFITEEKYKTLYQQSIENPEAFWADRANEFIDFYKPFDTVLSGPFNATRWFDGAELNVSYQCIDRHLKDNAERIAIIWEGDEPNISKTLSYQDLHDEVCRMANVLKNQGIQKGDTVCIYLPMIPEAAISMLACARIGAVHSVVFAGFSPEALRHRINDAKCKLVITTQDSPRGGKVTKLGDNVKKALEDTPSITHALFIEPPPTSQGLPKLVNWQEEKDKVEASCEPEVMQAEDPLFILYTSGSTGKPKGILHTQAGYILYAAMTHKYVFDYHPEDIYWCGADVGWVTGHSYIVYGPLANCATTLMFQGTPTYPNPSRFWQVIDKHQVNIFYTAPTAIRALMREGNKWVNATKRDSLRLLASVGEPINPEVWLWYYNVVGNTHCPVVDTWWQTETGGIMLCPLPGATKLKPGAAQTPFFGIEPMLVDEKGEEVKEQGLLAINKPWPGIARTIYHDAKRFETYFANNRYIAGDEALVDEYGYFQITGRADDVLNVSGHRLGSAEIENALCEHVDVAEAAVVGHQHEVKGEAIYAYVTLKSDSVPSESAKRALIDTVKQAIGPIAKPEVIQWANELPKTRSGKIMRRILRKIANKDFEHFGDLSTLANPQVVDELIDARKSIDV